MGYELCLKRNDRSEIALKDWRALVEATESLRPATGDAVVINPITGDTVRIPSKEGDAEVYDPNKGTWLPCFRYSPHRISFMRPKDFDDPQSPFRQMVIDLATSLGAQVVGEEGELYDRESTRPTARKNERSYDRPEDSPAASEVASYLRYPSSSLLALLLAATVTASFWLVNAALSDLGSPGVLVWLAWAVAAGVLFGIMYFFRTGILTSTVIAFVAWSHLGAFGFAVLSGGVYEGPEQYPLVLFVWCTVWPMALLHGLLAGVWARRVL